MLEADERPLDMEQVIRDNVGLAVLHQELKVVHGLCHALFKEHVADQAQVNVSWKGKGGQVNTMLKTT